MPAQLLALNDGPSILVDKPILLLGRHPECDIQLDSRKVSRRHCCIAQVNDYLVVRDLDSTNGIRINGVRVLEGQLHAGDELTIGHSRYQVTWDENAVPPAGAVASAVPKSPVPLPRPRPVPHTSMDPDDEMLEDCDEPVPLLDTAHRPYPGELPPPRQPHEEDSVVLPEDLRLLPGRTPHGLVSE